MAKLRSKVTTRGRVSVPAEIRRKLDIRPGSVLEWGEEGKKVFVRRVAPASSEDIHHALFPTPPKPRTLEELKQGIEDYIREKHPR